MTPPPLVTQCTCNWFYSGTSCKSISISGALVLGIVISICSALVVIVLARNIYRKGKEEAIAGTLKDLREHLLESHPYPSGDLEDVEVDFCDCILLTMTLNIIMCLK